MENKFIINNDERERILSLHESSTKQQYLNLLNEEEINTYTLKSDVTLTNTKITDNNLYLYKGTQFYKSKTKPDVLQTSQVTVNRPQMMTGQRTQSDNFKTNVYYSCSKGKFWIDGKTSYYNQEFQKNLTPLCENKNKNTTSISPKTIGGKLLTNKTQQVKVNPQQFAQQVNNNNIEIQKTLGVQQPNGQLTTTDIDNLLKKLG